MFTIHPPRQTSADEAAFSYTCETFGAFEERVIWPMARGVPLADQTALLNLTAALLGVSYYKAAAASAIKVEFALGPASQAAVKSAYRDGLGEFFFRNQLPYPPDQTWAFAEGAAASPPSNVTTGNHSVVAFGGGKDSHVAMAKLRAKKRTFEPVSVILDDRVGEHLAAMLAEKLTFIRRVIDPKLIAMARDRRGHNGHVPITAINSAILMVHALRTGADAVIFANERGASKPTIVHDGHPINHQFSKSFDYEAALRAAFGETVGEMPEWFSGLRPYSELWIGREMADAKRAHRLFTSCNRNFVFAGRHVLKDGERWCGTCPKCVFTATILAPWCNTMMMDAIFEKDVLGNADNIAMARDLAGLGAMKPWECVGDIEDTSAALAMLTIDPDWKDRAVVKALAPELDARYGLANLRTRFKAELETHGPHAIPERYQSVFL